MGGNERFERQMAVEEFYNQISEKRTLARAALFSDASRNDRFAAAHSLLKDLESLCSKMQMQEGAVFTQGINEFAFALEAAANSLYRHAYASLRLSFELMLSAVWFSANRTKLMLWLGGHADLNWARLVDDDVGVFSTDFLRAFGPTLLGYKAQYNSLSKAIYREISEMVHGNQTNYLPSEMGIAYQAELVEVFLDKVDSFKICIFVAYVSRFMGDLGLQERNDLEHILLDTIGHIPEVKEFFETENG